MDYEIGVQSYTYRNFTTDEICEELAGTDVAAIELSGIHLDHEASPEEIATITAQFDDVNVDICGFGVDTFNDPVTVRDQVSFADSLDVEYISADFDPANTLVIEELLDCVAAYDLDIAIHNHGPTHRYSTVEDVLDVIRAYPDTTRLGACVDTGHYLRSGQRPGDVIPELADRTHAIHLKDFDTENTEVVPGDGSLDIGDLLTHLSNVGFDRPLVIEYELDPDNPTPAIQTTVQRVHRHQQSKN